LFFYSLFIFILNFKHPYTIKSKRRSKRKDKRKDKRKGQKEKQEKKEASVRRAQRWQGKIPHTDN